MQAADGVLLAASRSLADKVPALILLLLNLFEV